MPYKLPKAKGTVEQQEEKRRLDSELVSDLHDAENSARQFLDDNVKPHVAQYDPSLPGILSDDEIWALSAKVLAYCEAQAGVTFHDYQRGFGMRLVYSVLVEDVSTLTALFSRQSGKTETVAVILDGLLIILPILAEMYQDPRITKFRHGFWVGIFGPTYELAGIMYNRMRSRIFSAHALQVLRDPDIAIDLSNFKGKALRFPNGSFVDVQSAGPGSKIEGKTYHIVILEECLHGSTILETPSGPLSIQQIWEQDYRGVVRAMDEQTGKSVWSQVKRSMRNPVATPTYDLLLSDGSCVSCTAGHRWFTQEYGWITTAELDMLVNFGYPPDMTERDDVPIINGRRVYGPVYDRDIAWRFKHPVSVPELGEPTICGQSLTFAAASGRGQMAEGSDLRSGYVPCSTKSRKRGHVGAGRVRMLTHLSSVARFVLHKSTEECSGVGVADRWAGSLGLAVDGRRSSRNAQKLWPVVQQWLHSRRKCIIANLDVSAVKFTSLTNSGRAGEAFQNVADSFISLGCLHIERRNPSIRTTRVSIQTSRVASFYLRNMRPGVSVSKRKSCCKYGKNVTLLRCLPDGTLTAVRPRAVSRSAQTNFTWSYDITTDRGTFFANGILCHNCQDIPNIKIRKSIHPMLAATAGPKVKIGTPNPDKNDFYDSCTRNKERDGRYIAERGTDGFERKRTHFEYDYTHAARCNPRYAKYVQNEMEELGFDSDEFRMSYRLHWLTERNRFITQEILDKCAVKRGVTLIWKDDDGEVRGQFQISGLIQPSYGGSVVISADFGKVKSSTVLTAAQVWYEREFYDGQDTRYRTHVLDWLELEGDDHEQQHGQIMEWLGRFPKIYKFIGDATGKGDPILSRLRAELESRGTIVVPFVFSTQSKHDGYTVFSKELYCGRFTFPFSKETMNRRTRRFYKQMLDLSKTWKGRHMVVEKQADDPESKDDYCDSAMMLCWGVNVDHSGYTEELVENPFLSDRRGYLLGERRQRAAWISTQTKGQGRRSQAAWV